MLESLYIFIGHGARGLMWAAIVLTFTVLVTSFMPSEAHYLSIAIPLDMFKRTAILMGAFFAINIWVMCWIKDFKRDYIPHWYLN